MKNKVVGIFVCMLLIITSISVSGNVNFYKNNVKIQSTLSKVDDVDWWPMFRHDLNHTGNSTSPGGPEDNTILWTYNTKSEISSSPAVVNGKVYIGSNNNNIYCLDANNGDLIWNYTALYRVRSSPAVSGGKVYIGSDDFKLYCLDAENGSKIWDYETGDEVVSHPVIFDSKIYFGSKDRKVYCLDSENGKSIWNYTVGSVTSSPAISDGKVYIGSGNSKVYCLNAENGTKLWEYTTGYTIGSSPAISNGKVYIGSHDNKVYCLNAENGTKIWDYTTDFGIPSSPAVAYNKVYIGSADFKVYCLNAENGTKIWDYTTYQVVYSSPAVADGKVYVGSEDYRVYCLDAENGKKLWHYTTGSFIFSSPAIADGIVYIGSKDGQVYAFGKSKPPETPEQPDGPSEGITDVKYTFTTSTTDPEGNKILYKFDWGDGTFSDWLGPFNSGATGEGSHSWNEEGDYEIRVKAKDNRGSSETLWSEPHIITIVEGPILDIKIISGGLLKIDTIIQNIGRVDATYVNWSIILEGGLIVIGRKTQGTLPYILAFKEEKVSSKPIFGFGSIVVQVTAEIPEGSDMREQSGFVFLFFINVIPTG